MRHIKLITVFATGFVFVYGSFCLLVARRNVGNSLAPSSLSEKKKKKKSSEKDEGSGAVAAVADDFLSRPRPLLILNHNPKAGGGSIIEFVREIRGNRGIRAKKKRQCRTVGDIVAEHQKNKNESLTNDPRDAFIDVAEFCPSTFEDRRYGYVIGSVREPCSHYLSLWTYNSNGHGRFKRTAAHLHGTEAPPFFNATADVKMLRRWVRHGDVNGVLERRFESSYGGPDGNGADCFVFVELFQYTLVRCLRLYEAQGGSVDWNHPEMAPMLVKADDQERDLLREIGYDDARRLANDDEGDDDGDDDDNHDHDNHEFYSVDSKNDALGNPQAKHHAACATYFDPETRELVENGPERNLYMRFGYRSCCSQEFDYSLILPERVKTKIRDATNATRDDALKIGSDIDWSSRSARSDNRMPSSLSSIKPIVWVHIPKTGTSFIHTLVFGVCPGWPENWFFDSKKGIAKNFKNYRLDEHCVGGFDEKYGSPGRYGHVGILSEQFYQQRRGKFVGMFRKPELRTLSAWFNDPVPWGAKGGETNLTRYASSPKHRGCTVKSLVRGRKLPCNSAKAVTTEETELAISRLKGFAFIGLTDYWDLSICLWHAMFGGPIFLDELQNVRPGHGQSGGKEAALSIIRKFPDAAEEAVFAAAEKIFWDNIRLHRVTNATCALAVAQAVKRTQR